MASPSAAELNTQLQNAVDMLENYLSGLTVVADINTYEQSLESDFVAEQSAGAALFRSRVAAAAGSSASVLAPWVTAYAHHIVGTPERDTQAALDRIYQYWVDNSISIKERNFTFGSPTAGGGNTGDGQLYRLTADENALDLEAQFPDVKTLKCIADAETGADKHEETFEIRGQNAARDVLEVTGSGVVLRNFKARSSNDSILANPTFSQYSVSGAGPSTGSPYTLVSADTITDWTADDVTKLQLDVDEFFRDVVGDTTPTSLRFLDNVVLTQTFEDANISLNPDVPYMVVVAVKRESTADGTLTIEWGNKTQAVTVSTLSDGAWNLVAIDRDRDLWPSQFNEEDGNFKLTYSGRTTGTIILDEVIFVPMDPFDGSWYTLVGGGTKWQLDDSWTVTDSIPSDSKIQKWLWRSFGRYLPHSATPTIADP